MEPPTGVPRNCDNYVVVLELLKGLQLQRLFNKFVENGVDDTALLLLDEKTILGLHLPIGPRMKILKAIHALHPPPSDKASHKQAPKEPAVQDPPQEQLPKEPALQVPPKEQTPKEPKGRLSPLLPTPSEVQEPLVQQESSQPESTQRSPLSTGLCIAAKRQANSMEEPPIRNTNQRSFTVASPGFVSGFSRKASVRRLGTLHPPQDEFPDPTYSKDYTANKELDVGCGDVSIPDFDSHIPYDIKFVEDLNSKSLPSSRVRWRPASAPRVERDEQKQEVFRPPEFLSIAGLLRDAAYFLSETNCSRRGPIIAYLERLCDQITYFVTELREARFRTPSFFDPDSVDWTDPILREGILVRTFLFLSPQERAATRLVCRRWRNVVDDHGRELFPRLSFGTDTEVSVIQKADYLRGVQHVSVVAPCHVTDDGLARFLDFCRGVRTLNLSYCQSVTDSGLRIIASQLADTLEAINLTGLRAITDAGIFHLVACTKLKKLFLRGSRQLGDHTAHACAQIPSLRLLQLACTSITDDGVCLIGRKLPKLQLLCLWGCSRVGDAGVEVVLRNPDLWGLNIARCNAVTNHFTQALLRSERSLRFGPYGPPDLDFP